MAVTNGWGQGVINNTNGWGKLATNNIGAGSVYENSASGDTALIGTSAAFSYSASSFTQADADPTPTITGTTGGTFSGTSGLVFVSTSTGQIDLSASTIAAHVVTYTVGGVSSNFNLSVLAAPFASTQSFSFDGVDDFIGVNSLDTSVLPTGSFSVSVWFNAKDNWFGGLFQIGDFAGNTGLTFAKRANGALEYRVNLSGGSKLGFTTNSKYNLNEWNHGVLVFDNSITNGSFKVYINGVQEHSNNESPSGQTISYPAGSELRIGQYNSSGSTQYFFEGNIDETAIFNTALSSSDVATIYGTGVPNDISSLNPLAWYRMGENSNYKSPQWLMPENSNFANSRFSNFSLEFDGVNDKIDVGTSSALEITGDLTISAWVYINTSGVFLGIVCKRDHGGTNYQFYTNNSATPKLRFFDGSTASGSTGTVSLNAWHHVAISVNSGVTNGSVFYIDGTASGTGTFTISSNDASLIIGADDHGFVSKFNGKIDEVSIFNSALSSSEISSMYNGGVPTTISGAVGHWRMGEEATFSTNWTIPDQVGSNDGTSINMTIEDRVGDAPNSSSNSVSFNMVEADRETDVPT